MKKTKLIYNLLASFMMFLVISEVHASYPLWTFSPDTNYPPQVSINTSQTATVIYTVQNQSKKAKSLIMKPMRGII